MKKILNFAVGGFAMYGLCKFLDSHVKKYLQNHRHQVMDKIEYILFGPDEEKDKYKMTYEEYARHAKATN